MENQLIQLINDKSIRKYLRYNFSPVYDEYQSYIPEWVINAINKYDPNKNTTLKTYVTLHLKYKFLTKLRLDRKRNFTGMMVYDYPIENVPDTSSPINYDKVHQVESTFKVIIDDFVNSKPRRSSAKVSYYDLIADYIGINRTSLPPREIASKYNVSKQYLHQVYTQFINFIKNEKKAFDKLQDLYYN